jgi:uroporphyrinogen decarboxylase
MTSKERVIEQIEHRETDRVPFVLDFEEDYDFEEDLKDGALERASLYFGGRAWRDRLMNDIVRVPTATLGHSPPVTRQDSGVPLFRNDIFGAQWRVDQRPPLLTKPALEEASLDRYQFPSADAYFEKGWYERALRVIDENKERFIVTGFGFGLFERSWILRGLENVLMDSITDPDFYQELIRRIFENQIEVLERILTLPIHGFRFCEDWSYQEGIMIGAERWRRYFKPYVAKMYAKVHEAGKYAMTHMCGSVAEILPELIEIGLDVYESVQPEAKNNNPYVLKRQFGDHITFWGGLGSQSIIPFGSPSEIRSEVKRLCEVMGKGGGYILSCAKPIQPDTPLENTVAIIESFAEQVRISI